MTSRFVQIATTAARLFAEGAVAIHYKQLTIAHMHPNKPAERDYKGMRTDLRIIMDRLRSAQFGRMLVVPVNEKFFDDNVVEVAADKDAWDYLANGKRMVGILKTTEDDHMFLTWGAIRTRSATGKLKSVRNDLDTALERKLINNSSLRKVRQTVIEILLDNGMPEFLLRLPSPKDKE